MKRNEFFKCIREYYGMSQEVLADKLMISRGAVSQHETGKNFPTMQDLELMAKVYELPLNMLSEDFAESLPEEEVSLLNRRPIERTNFELFLKAYGVSNSYFQVESVIERRKREEEQRKIILKYFNSLSSSRLSEMYDISRVIDQYHE